MPELTDLLHAAQPAGEPGFDAQDIADRVHRRSRRRRTAGAATLALVAAGLAAVVLIAPLRLAGDQPGALLQQPSAPSTAAEPSTESETDPPRLVALTERAADAGYEVQVRDSVPTAVTFRPMQPSPGQTIADGTVSATAMPSPFEDDDVPPPAAVALLYRLPVWATARGEPLVECGAMRLAAAPGPAYEDLVERMQCGPHYVVDLTTMAGVAESRQLVDVLVALLEAGAQVRSVAPEADPRSLTFHPPGPEGSAVTVMLRPTTNVADEIPIFVPLGAGVALEETGGMLAFSCGDIYLATTGPGAGGSDLPSVGVLPDALGCTPVPPRASQEMLDELTAAVEPPPPGVEPTQAPDDVVDRTNAREDRLLAAFAELGVDNVAGEPSHGGSGASMGFMWEGSLVYVYAGDARYDDPTAVRGEVIDLADGQADLGDGHGLPTVSFDCGDTGYSLQHDTRDADVHVRAAEALVAALGCTPTVGEN